MPGSAFVRPTADEGFLDAGAVTVSTGRCSWLIIGMTQVCTAFHTWLSDSLAAPRPEHLGPRATGAWALNAWGLKPSKARKHG